MENFDEKSGVSLMVRDVVDNGHFHLSCSFTTIVQLQSQGDRYPWNYAEHTLAIA